MLILSYPIRQSIAFSNTLFSLYGRAIVSSEEEIMFDLSRTKSLTPFGIILLTATIQECQLQEKKVHYRKPDDQNLEHFLNEIGFNKYFGLTRSEPVQDRIEHGHVQLKKETGIAPLFIERITDIFNYHLIISPGVRESLRMSLQEMMTNVVDHSGQNDYYVCAWNYPEKNQIRLCIADLGVGIRKSLSKVSAYRWLANDYEAIKEAVKDGVSSRSERAGLGLDHIRKFLKVNEGQICIISGVGKVFWKFDQGKTLEQKMKESFNGTIIKLVINIDKKGLYFLAEEKDYLFR